MTAQPGHRPALHAVPPAEPPSDGRALADPALLGWETPVPLSPVAQLPVFPVDVLPGWLADMVTATATTFQTPPDLPGCLALAALSTAAGGRAVVEIRPGWTEPVNIYTVVVSPPSTRKSPPFRVLTAPLRRAERDLIDAAKAEIEQARITRAAAERAQLKAEQSIDVGDGEDSATNPTVVAAVQAAMAAGEVTIPPVPRLLADDLTPETAANLLHLHGGRLAVLSAEGGLFATLAGRYSGTPNLDVFLKGYSGDSVQVDRMGREREFVDAPAITIGLTVQPAIIDELAKTALLRGTGLLARFLYSVPANTVGHRLARPDPIPTPVADTYDQHLRALVHALADWTDPAVLTFSPAADDRMAAYQDAIEPKLDPTGGEWAHIGDWAGKLAGQTARLAALLHAAAHPTHPWAQPIPDTTVAAAQQLGDYYCAHALTVFDRLGADPALHGARAVLAWIQHHHPTRFTKREAFTKLSRAQFPTMTSLDPALDLLEQHGHIRSAVQPERSGRGRPPSPAYLTHPHHHPAVSG
ncbi:MAG TPA: YfjI family protein [Pseudonocardiaceae bacterium]|nr:YfjI family protein [Pseudonocardiaceae bacterium]